MILDLAFELAVVAGLFVTLAVLAVRAGKRTAKAPPPPPLPHKQGDLRVVKVTDVLEDHRPPADGLEITFEVQRFEPGCRFAGHWVTVATYADERDAYTHVANVLNGYPIREVL